MTNGWGVENLAPAVDTKLTENAERSEREEQVLGDLYKAMRKVMTERRQNSESTPQTPKEIISVNERLHRVNSNMKGEVQRGFGPFSQNTQGRRSKRLLRLRKSSRLNLIYGALE